MLSMHEHILMLLGLNKYHYIFMHNLSYVKKYKIVPTLTKLFQDMLNKGELHIAMESS